LDRNRYKLSLFVLLLLVLVVGVGAVFFLFQRGQGHACRQGGGSGWLAIGAANFLFCNISFISYKSHNKRVKGFTLAAEVGGAVLFGL